MGYRDQLNILRKLKEEEAMQMGLMDPNEAIDSGGYQVQRMPIPEDLAMAQGGQGQALSGEMENILRQMNELPQEMPQRTADGPVRSWQAPNAELPMNSMRTESGPNAGRVISMNFGGQSDPVQDLQADFSQPIEIAGVGKGYWEKGGTGNAIVNGKRVMLGVDREATMRRQAKEIALDQGRQNLTKGQVDILKDLESIHASRAQRNIREDPNSQAVLEKKFGKAPDGMRWKTDGSGLEPLPGGKEEVKGKKALELLDEADKYIDESTGSGVGSVVDTVQGWFGSTNKGADAISRLKPIAGQLVAMMPRMEGPQSNFDVKLYQEMAGMIANPEIPVARRKAAMQTIRELNSRYANDPMGGGNGGGNVLQEARDAIKRGAPREAVIRRLQERGINPSGL
jgi:hypothetical protein